MLSVPLFGPRGPRPLLGRPGLWMDNQGPPTHSDNIIRPPFDDRPGGPRRGSGPGGPVPRFRGDRPRDRQSRWSKEDPKELPSRLEPNKKSTSEDEIRNGDSEPVRDTQTPCHDEKPIEEIEIQQTGEVLCRNANDSILEQAPIEQSQPPLQYERDTATPCHDEPEVPNIVAENPEAVKKEA